METIGQSHDVRLHKVREKIANEHIEIEKKKKKLEHLNATLAESTENQQRTLSSEYITSATTELKELQKERSPQVFDYF